MTWGIHFCLYRQQHFLYLFLCVWENTLISDILFYLVLSHLSSPCRESPKVIVGLLRTTSNKTVGKKKLKNLFISPCKERNKEATSEVCLFLVVFSATKFGCLTYRAETNFSEPHFHPFCCRIMQPFSTISQYSDKLHWNQCNKSPFLDLNFTAGKNKRILE